MINHNSVEIRGLETSNNQFFKDQMTNQGLLMNNPPKFLKCVVNWIHQFNNIVFSHTFSSVSIYVNHGVWLKLPTYYADYVYTTQSLIFYFFSLIIHLSLI